ncbi:hypothetical protein ABEV54_05775 [Peribacillus psychrosaccharolyticus]|uniref:hypothetical protein n=1 Tax=Peribacillus psychrosaccharolyticus TaxID=1407 RepID=UPI003D288D0F
MSKIKVWYVLVVISFVYQVSFLYIYLTERLVDFNSIFADTYWITAGLFGVIIGAYIMIKVNIGLFGKILAFIVMFFGFGLLGLLLLALAITSM